MKKKQTAVEFLESTMTEYLQRIYKSYIEEAKEMEKQQIKNAWFDSTIQFDNSAEMTYKKDFEQYYNETFKKD